MGRAICRSAAASTVAEAPALRAEGENRAIGQRAGTQAFAIGMHREQRTIAARRHPFGTGHRQGEVAPRTTQRGRMPGVPGAGGQHRRAGRRCDAYDGAHIAQVSRASRSTIGAAPGPSRSAATSTDGRLAIAITPVSGGIGASSANADLGTNRTSLVKADWMSGASRPVSASSALIERAG